MLLFNGTLLCAVILRGKREVLYCLLIFLFTSIGPHTLQRMELDLTFVNEVVFVEYDHGRYEVCSFKRLPNFVENFLPYV